MQLTNSSTVINPVLCPHCKRELIVECQNANSVFSQTGSGFYNFDCSSPSCGKRLTAVPLTGDIEAIYLAGSQGS
jgi:hypothetical protein